MKNILVIESSPRSSAESFSRKLTAAIVSKIKQEKSDVVETVRDLAARPFPHLEESILAAFFTPPEKHTDSNKKAVLNSNEAIAELKAADTVVIYDSDWNPQNDAQVGAGSSSGGDLLCFPLSGSSQMSSHRPGQACVSVSVGDQAHV